MWKQIKLLIQRRNVKNMQKKGFIHCAHCKNLILKSDKYCQYCGKPTRKETF